MSREAELETALKALYDVAQKCLRPRAGETFIGAAAVQLTTAALAQASRVLRLPPPPAFGAGKGWVPTSRPQWQPTENDINAAEALATLHKQGYCGVLWSRDGSVLRVGDEYEARESLVEAELSELTDAEMEALKDAKPGDVFIHEDAGFVERITPEGVEIDAVNITTAEGERKTIETEPAKRLRRARARASE